MSNDFYEFLIQNPTIFTGRNLDFSINHLNYNPQLSFHQLNQIADSWGIKLKNYKEYIELNPNINWEVVENTINDFPWDFKQLSKNPNFNWDIVSSNPELNWDYNNLSNHIPWEIINENPNYEWDYDRVIGYNKSIDFELLKHKKLKHGFINMFACNPNFKIEHIYKHEFNNNLMYMHRHIISNKNFKLTDILEYYDYLKNNENYNYIHQDNGKYLSWVNLIHNPNLKYEDFINYKGFFNLSDELYGYLSNHPNITYDIVKKNNKNPWNVMHLAQNPNFLLYDVLSIDLLKIPGKEHIQPIFYLKNIVKNPMNEPYFKKNSVNLIENWYSKRLHPNKWVSIRKGYIVKNWFDSPDCKVANRLRENWFKRGILSDILGY